MKRILLLMSIVVMLPSCSRDDIVNGDRTNLLTMKRIVVTGGHLEQHLKFDVAPMTSYLSILSNTQSYAKHHLPWVRLAAKLSLSEVDLAAMGYAAAVNLFLTAYPSDALLNPADAVTLSEGQLTSLLPYRFRCWSWAVNNGGWNDGYQAPGSSPNLNFRLQQTSRVVWESSKLTKTVSSLTTTSVIKEDISDMQLYGVFLRLVSHGIKNGWLTSVSSKLFYANISTGFPLSDVIDYDANWWRFTLPGADVSHIASKISVRPHHAFDLALQSKSYALAKYAVPGVLPKATGICSYSDINFDYPFTLTYERRINSLSKSRSTTHWAVLSSHSAGSHYISGHPFISGLGHDWGSYNARIIEWMDLEGTLAFPTDSYIFLSDVLELIIIRTSDTENTILQATGSYYSPYHAAYLPNYLDPSRLSIRQGDPGQVGSIVSGFIKDCSYPQLPGPLLVTYIPGFIQTQNDHVLQPTLLSNSSL